MKFLISLFFALTLTTSIQAQSNWPPPLLINTQEWAEGGSQRIDYGSFEWVPKLKEVNIRCQGRVWTIDVQYAEILHDEFGVIYRFYDPSGQDIVTVEKQRDRSSWFITWDRSTSNNTYIWQTPTQ